MILLSADLHIRRKPPKSRIDNWLETLERKIRFICQFCTDYNCPWLIAGDFFDKPRPGEFIKQWLTPILKEYPVDVICTPGQHDMPNHQLALLPDSGLSVLAASGLIHLITDPNTPLVLDDYIIYGCPFGTTPKDIKYENTSKRRILLWHHMIINQQLWPGQEADKATKIQKLYPMFDLICSGDNHTSFAVANDKGKWLVNPGSMVRLKSDQVDHIPSVYVYEKKKVERIELPIEKNVFNVGYIKEEKRKSGRFDTLAEKLETGFVVGRNFDEKMVSYLETKEVRPSVRNLILEAMK